MPKPHTIAKLVPTARQQLRPEQAHALLEEQARSGKTLTAFARERGLQRQRLSWWKSRLAPGTPAFVAVEPAAPPAVAAPAFELALPDGGVLRIPPGSDPAALTAVVQALRAVRPC